MRRPYHVASAPAPAVAIISVPPSLQAATDAGAGVGPIIASIEHRASKPLSRGAASTSPWLGMTVESTIEPEVRMIKTAAGIAVTWAAADGEKFIISKTCFTDHNFTDATTASRILLSSGEWVDTAPDAVGCDQVHYEVRRVA